MYNITIATQHVLKLFLEKHNWETKGMSINGRYLNHLRITHILIADILISLTAQELQGMLTDVSRDSVKGLSKYERKQKLKLGHFNTNAQTNAQSNIMNTDIGTFEVSGCDYLSRTKTK